MCQDFEASVDLKLCILAFREQGHCTGFPQQRIAQRQQILKGKDRARGHDVHRSSELLCKILHSFLMHYCGGVGQKLGGAQEARLFRIALDQVHASSLPAQRTSDDQPGKPGP